MKPPRLMKIESNLLKLAVCSTVMLAAGVLNARVISYDAAPVSMNEQGTIMDGVIDYATYILGENSSSGVIDHASNTNISSSKWGVELIIKNGWTLNTGGSGYIGNFYGALDKSGTSRVIVNGMGSAWNVTLDTYVGRQGDTNTLTVRNGASVTGGNRLRVGNEGSFDNLVEIKDGGSAIFLGGVEVGSVSRTVSDTVRFGNNNQILVEGFGSVLTSSTVKIGNGGTGNKVTLVDEGLFKLTASTDALIIAADNSLQLDGGYLALKLTDQSAADALLATLLSGEKIEVWKDDSWLAATVGEVTATYYATDSLALAATGYDGLGGYAVFAVAIPEPGTAGLLLVGLGGMVLWRSRMSHKTT